MISPFHDVGIGFSFCITISSMDRVNSKYSIVMFLDYPILTDPVKNGKELISPFWASPCTLPQFLISQGARRYLSLKKEVQIPSCILTFGNTASAESRYALMTIQLRLVLERTKNPEVPIFQIKSFR